MKVALLIVALSGVARGNVQGSWGSPPAAAAAAVRANPSSLPQGWSEHMDPSSGQPYYYNAADGTTTWDRPQNPLDIAAAATAVAASDSKETSETSSRLDSGTATATLKDHRQHQPHSQDSSSFPATTNVESQEPVKQEQSGGSVDDATRNLGMATDFGSAIPVDSSSVATQPTADTLQDKQPPEDPVSVTSPAAAWEQQQQQQQQDPQRPWSTGPDAAGGAQLQQPQPSDVNTGSGGWGMPTTTTEANKKNEYDSNPGGWNLGGNQDRRPSYPYENDPKQPILVDDRRRGDGGGQTNIRPQQMGYMQQQQQQQMLAGSSWRGMQGPLASSQQQGPPLQHQGPPAQPLGPQQHWPPAQQQGRPQQQQQQQVPPAQQGLPQQQQQGPPPGRFQRPVPRIPETQPQRPPPGQYGRGPPYGPSQYDGSYSSGQPQYYNPQQQQQPQQQYGNQLYSGYGQYSGSQELVPKPEPLAGVRDSLGKTWQSVLGFGNKTKEVLSTTRDTVVTNARDAGQSITAKSTGWWGQARNAIGSVFESNDKGANEYSMTGIYGSNDGLQGNRIPPQGYGGQPYGYPQQQGSRHQNFPPNYYQGRPDMPPQPPGRSQLPPPGQPPQRGQQPPPQHGQQQQPQYPPPGSRYPPGYIPPNPRSDAPYAHQQQPPPQNRGGGPQQNQWGLRGPPDPNQRGPPPGPQQPQYPPPVMGRNSPYGPGSPPPPVQQQQQPDPSKSVAEEEKEQRQRDPWHHPGLGNEGY